MKSKSEKNSKTHAISWLVRSQISVLRLPPPRPPAARSRESSGRERDFLAWFWGSGQKLSVSRISASWTRRKAIAHLPRASRVVGRGTWAKAIRASAFPRIPTCTSTAFATGFASSSSSLLVVVVVVVILLSPLPSACTTASPGPPLLGRCLGRRLGRRHHKQLRGVERHRDQNVRKRCAHGRTERPSRGAANAHA